MRFATVLTAAACLLALGACNKPDYIEIEPKERSFTRRGDKVWARIIAKSRQGRSFPGVKASWKSSNEDVFKVDEAGRLETVGPGRAVLTATYDGLEAEAPVEVITVEQITVEPLSLDLDMETGSTSLKVVAFDHQGRELKGRNKPRTKCGDEKVCTSAEESVFPSNPGNTVLTVSVEGQQVEIPVTVTEKPKKR